MKKLIQLFAGLFVLVCNLTTSAQDKSLLWQVTGKGLTKPSFLFGTIHVICPSDYIWTESMKRSLDRSDKLCLEMDLDDEDVMIAVSSGLVDRNGRKLSEYFSEDQYFELQNYVKDSMGMDISFFESMKPIALQTLIATRGAAMCESPISYEDNLLKATQAKFKEILGLETVDEQLSALETIPADSVVKGIMDAIHHTSDDTKAYNNLIAAYRSQDISKLHDMIISGEGIGDATVSLIDDRNKRWITRMPEMMQKSSVFFAFGAGHLSGQNGVINLLREQGYRVQPVR